jgi:2-keto-3-deoxy-galactonokinase
LIGSPQLTQLYATACAFSNYDTHQVDGVAASLAGLTQVYRRLSKKDAAHGI